MASASDRPVPRAGGRQLRPHHRPRRLKRRPHPLPLRGRQSPCLAVRALSPSDLPAPRMGDQMGGEAAVQRGEHLWLLCVVRTLDRWVIR